MKVWQTSLFLVLLFASVATAVEVNQQTIDASLTTITDLDTGETQHFLNLEFDWRCEHSVEFEIWVQWYTNGQYTSREDVFDPAPAPGNHPTWDAFDESTEVFGYSAAQNMTGFVYIKVTDSVTGAVSQSSRSITLP